jgi:hypothetical protein
MKGRPEFEIIDGAVVSPLSRLGLVRCLRSWQTPKEVLYGPPTSMAAAVIPVTSIARPICEMSNASVRDETAIHAADKENH